MIEPENELVHVFKFPIRISRPAGFDAPDSLRRIEGSFCPLLLYVNEENLNRSTVSCANCGEIR